MKILKKPLLFIALALMCSCEETVIVDDTTINISENDQPVADCTTAPAEWFTQANGTRVTPAPNEGPTSVFADNATVTNCDFQRWSWQKFLWLTNETNGRPFFLDNLTQVTSTADTLGKGGNVILTDTLQASGDKLTTPAAPTKSTVFYSIMANDILLDALHKYGPMVNNDSDSTELKGITFPVGALEMKTSWLDATALGADSATYFITDGTIDGAPKRVALLGIHVVGIVENHPEFIWATFEHDALAPMYDWTNATDTTDAEVTSTTAYPLFGANATATIKNIIPGQGIDTDVFSVYDHGVPVEINEAGDKVFMSTSQSNAQQNLSNIEDLNKSVKSQLTGIWKNYFLNSSLWINTEGYDGLPAQAALLDSLGGDLGNSAPGKLPRGSVAAYNITMESYVQVGGFPPAPSIHAAKVSDLANCFYCHSASYTGAHSPLKISHLFNGYTGRINKGMSKAQVKLQHLEVVRARAILNGIKND